MSRWLVAGWGRVGQVHTAALGLLPSATVVGVAEADVQLRERAAALGHPVFDDLPAALDELRPDALSIALPHHLHGWAVELAAERGIPAVVEKPLARSLHESRQMIERAESGGIQLGCVMNYRSYAQLQWVQQIIATGEFVVQSVLIDVDLPRAQQAPGWQIEHGLAGGGLLLTIGVHYLDLVSWWLGVPSRVVGTTHPTSIEECAAGLLEFPGGRTASVSMQALAPTYAGVRIVLVGTSGRVVIQGSTVVEHPPGLTPPPVETEGTELAFGPGHLEYFRAADMAVSDRRPFPVSAADGAVAVAVVEAWYRSARSGDWEVVPSVL